jgi:glutamate synthase (NADPH/NADH) small chain
MRQMEAEGVKFVPNTNVGSSSYPVDRLRGRFDAVVLAGGATQPRDLPVSGRKLAGVHFAMEFLTQQNRVCEGDTLSEQISADGKHVIILGGGDTGSDCLGTSNRQGALSVHQFELMPEPPPERTEDMPWPYWPMILRTSSSHEEGVTREFGINTVELIGGPEGRVTGLRAQRVRMDKDAEGRGKMVPVPGSDTAFKADLVLLAMGFVGPEKGPLLEGLGLELTARGNVAVNDRFESSQKGVFACGDMQRGQSLVVWAIWEGRECARGVDAFLAGRSDLLASPNVSAL